MYNRSDRLAGILLAAFPIAFIALFALLQANFEGYPEILRAPVPRILQAFEKGAPVLQWAWTGLVLLSLGLLPLTVLVRSRLGRRDGVGDMFVLAGTVAGIAQGLGLARWLFVVPQLAELHRASPPGSSSQLVAETSFEIVHLVLGKMVGEQLGYLATGLWTILLGWMLADARRSGVAPRVFAGLLAAGMWAGLLESTIGPGILVVVSGAYAAWAIWLVWSGSRLVFSN